MMNKEQYNVEYIKKSNINPILKIIYLRNKYINPNLFTQKKRASPKKKIIRRRKSSVSHYSVVI